MRLFLILIFILLAPSAHAGCSCSYDMKTVKELVAAHNVFVGRAISTSESPLATPREYTASTKFEVLDVWNGLVGKTATVNHVRSEHSSRCGLTFEPGSISLILAKDDTINNLVTGSCLMRRVPAPMIHHALSIDHDLYAGDPTFCYYFREHPDDPVWRDDIREWCTEVIEEEGIDLISMTLPVSQAWLDDRYGARP